MIYIKSHDLHRYALLSDWGEATCYLEIGDDLYALRRVEMFANGNALRFDRHEWIDATGMSLGEMKYDAHKWAKWWGPSIAITADEFETMWQRALKSPNQPQTYVDDAGQLPRP